MEFAEQHHRVPDSFSEQHHRRRSHRYADERVERHGGGQSQGLSHGLRFLRFGVAREIGDVERHGGPEPHHAGERRDEKSDELGAGMELAGRAEHRSQAAGFAGDPPEQQQADPQHKGSADAFQDLDGFDAAPDHRDIEQPESEEADPLAPGGLCGAGPQNFEHGKDGLAADPALNAEPSASHQGAQHGRDIGSADAE